MKKIFTLLVAVVLFTAANAQNVNRDRDDVNRSIAGLSRVDAKLLGLADRLGRHRQRCQNQNRLIGFPPHVLSPDKLLRRLAQAAILE